MDDQLQPVGRVMLECGACGRQFLQLKLLVAHALDAHPYRTAGKLWRLQCASRRMVRAIAQEAQP